MYITPTVHVNAKPMPSGQIALFIIFLQRNGDEQPERRMRHHRAILVICRLFGGIGFVHTSHTDSGLRKALQEDLPSILSLLQHSSGPAVGI